MALYVNRVSLEFDGQVFTDFESFTDNSVTKAKQVNMMNKTGHALMTPRYGFSVSTKVPVTGWPIDLFNIVGGTATVEYDGGRRVTYTGVHTLETGEGTSDGETELTRAITFGAEDKRDE